jgi:hypothetical protein
MVSEELKTIKFRYLHEERLLECRIEGTTQHDESPAADETVMPGSFTRFAQFPCLDENFLRNLSAYRYENDYETLLELLEKPVVFGRTLDEATRARMRNDWINYAACMLVDAAEQLQYHLIGEWTPMHALSDFGWYDLRTWDALVGYLSGDYVFHLDSGWLTFRPEATVMMRRFAIPVETLRLWLKPDTITLDWLSQIVSQCSAAQIDGLVALRRYGLAVFNLSSEELLYQRREGAPLASLSSAQIPAVRQWLRFYATLSPLQRQNLQKGSSLSWQDLNLAQRKALVAALQIPLDEALGAELYLISYRLTLQKPLNEDDEPTSTPELPAELQNLRIRLDASTLSGYTYPEGEPQGVRINQQFVAFVVFTDEKEVLRVPVRVK